MCVTSLNSCKKRRLRSSYWLSSRVIARFGPAWINLIAVLSLSFLIQPDLNGGPPNSSKFEFLTIDQGLSDNYITHILQDSYGYLWFGTMDGLNRYDGESFVTYRNDPGNPNSLSGNHVRSFVENERGNLFIATNNDGLDIYDRGQGTFSKANLKGHTSISTLEYVSSDTLWVGTLDGYLLRYNPAQDSLEWQIQIPKDFENTNTNIVSDIFVDETQTVWIASGLGGLDKLESSTDSLTHILLADTLAEPFRRNGCGSIVQDGEGRFWVSRVSGLDSYRPSSGAHRHFSFKDSKGEKLKSFSVLLELDGSLTLSSYYDVINFNVKTSAHHFVASILPKYFTSALYRDSGGVLWMGTMGHGAVKIDPRIHQFNTSEGNYLPHLFLDEYALLKDSAGVDLSLRDRDILSIVRTRNSDLWVATQFWGLYHIDHETQRIRKYTLGKQDIRQRFQVIYEVFEDNHGSIWVSTVGGLCRLDKTTGGFEYHRLYPGDEMAYFAINSHDYLDISCIYQDERDIFWLGTPELGLIRFDPSNDSIAYLPVAYPGDPSHRSVPILDLIADVEHPSYKLWLGTEGGGLVHYDLDKQEAVFLTVNDGLPNNIVNRILPGVHGSYWLSTNLGLARFTPASGQFVNYDVRDGLQSNGFNRREAYRTDSGELYFGGTYGFNHFYPGEISDVKLSTPIVLTGIELLNEPIVFGGVDSILSKPLSLVDELILDHHQGMMVTFHFTSLSTTNQHRDQFIYTLNNFDNQWIKNGSSHSATYTNLNPGNYTFRVRDIQNMDANDPPELSLHVIVLPPFWATWWFLGITLILSLTMVTLIIRRQLRLMQQKRLRQQLFSQQLLAYQEEERKRISAELHDGIGQDLLIIKNTLQLGLNRLDADAEPTRIFKSISETVSQTIQEVRTISHNLSPQHLERLGLSAALESMLESLEASTDIFFTTDIEEVDTGLPVEKEIHIYRIAQEALNNIVKHSQGTQAFIKLGIVGETLILEIHDNGRGIPVGTKGTQKGIGLAGMNERSQLLHSELKILPNHPQGTQVILKLQLESEHGNHV